MEARRADPTLGGLIPDHMYAYLGKGGRVQFVMRWLYEGRHLVCHIFRCEQFGIPHDLLLLSPELLLSSLQRDLRTGRAVDFDEARRCGLYLFSKRLPNRINTQFLAQVVPCDEQPCLAHGNVYSLFVSRTGHGFAQRGHQYPLRWCQADFDRLAGLGFRPTNDVGLLVKRRRPEWVVIDEGPEALARAV
jgi:hypothetical protein